MNNGYWKKASLKRAESLCKFIKKYGREPRSSNKAERSMFNKLTSVRASLAGSKTNGLKAYPEYIEIAKEYGLDDLFSNSTHKIYESMKVKSLKRADKLFKFIYRFFVCRKGRF